MIKKIEYADTVTDCVSEFKEKNKKYGQSWIEDRLFTLAQQVFIKLNRIKTIQIIKEQKVEDSITSEFPAIFNYCMLALVRIKWQKEKFIFDHSIKHEEVVIAYEKTVKETVDLYKAKNHDYGEIWRDLNITTMVDFMLNKYRRLEAIYKLTDKAEEDKFDDYKEIFKDIGNYSIFCYVRIKEGFDPMR
jgi:hypothetical protein